MPADSRGFQMKLAALATAIEAAARDGDSHVIMSDADILWLNSPVLLCNGLGEDCEGVVTGTREPRVGIFLDIWNGSDRRNERSATMRVLQRSHGVKSALDAYECESGVVVVETADTKKASAFAAVCRHLYTNHRYYFDLSYGDKDLYDIASVHARYRRVSLGDAKMLGFFEDGADLAAMHSMLQRRFAPPGTHSHIHCTLFPTMADESRMRPDPTHIVHDTRTVRNDPSRRGALVGEATLRVDPCITMLFERMRRDAREFRMWWARRAERASLGSVLKPRIISSSYAVEAVTRVIREREHLSRTSAAVSSDTQHVISCSCKRRGTGRSGAWSRMWARRGTWTPEHT
eukprot:6198886-Pleurochrysis_carterae.AAC.7